MSKAVLIYTKDLNLLDIITELGNHISQNREKLKLLSCRYKSIEIMTETKYNHQKTAVYNS